jgi:hypothetical protein
LDKEEQVRVVLLKDEDDEEQGIDEDEVVQLVMVVLVDLQDEEVHPSSRDIREP